MRKAIIVALLATMLASTASATIVVFDVNVGDLNRGAGFVGGSDWNIHFRVYDDNVESMSGSDYNLTIWYKTGLGGTLREIVSDVNLGDANTLHGNGYCDRNISSFAQTGGAHCQYNWNDVNQVALADGNYYIDVNVALVTDVTNWLVYDHNADTNYSFYLDNTPPHCELEKQRGSEYKWILSGESDAEVVGSTTTLYYSEVTANRTPNYVTTAGTLGSSVIEFFERGKYDYACYVIDDAGNRGATKEYTVEYPPAGGVVVVQPGGGGGGAVAGAIQAIALPDLSTVASDPVGFATANPAFVGIVAVAAYLLFFNKKKRRG